jgi:hypothetical protein
MAKEYSPGCKSDDDDGEEEEEDMKCVRIDPPTFSKADKVGTRLRKEMNKFIKESVG